MYTVANLQYLCTVNFYVTDAEDMLDRAAEIGQKLYQSTQVKVTTVHC